MLRKYSCLLLIGLSLFTGCSSPTKPIASQPQPSKEVTLDASEISTITASNNRQYRIQTRFPASYSRLTTKTYPIILKIDGQWDYPLAASVFNNIYFDGQMPEALVIGIDWVDTNPSLQAVRMRDLSPVADKEVEFSGQAAAFVKTLADNILPALNKRFRSNGQVYLLGGSLGANFVTYALLEQPQAFSGALAIGGNYGSSVDVYRQLIQARQNSNALAGKRLYLGVGTGDAAAPHVIALAEQLQNAKLAGLNLKLDALAGYGHSGMNVPGYAAGYKYLFERPQLNISTAQLKTLEGTYNALNAKNEPLTLKLTEQGLCVIEDGKARLLYAQSANTFYYEGDFYNLTFTTNKTAINVTLETFFGSSEYSRKLTSK